MPLNLREEQLDGLYYVPTLPLMRFYISAEIIHNYTVLPVCMGALAIRQPTGQRRCTCIVPGETICHMEVAELIHGIK